MDQQSKSARTWLIMLVWALAVMCGWDVWLRKLAAIRSRLMRQQLSPSAASFSQAELVASVRERWLPMSAEEVVADLEAMLTPAQLQAFVISHIQHRYLAHVVGHGDPMPIYALIVDAINNPSYSSQSEGN